MAQKALRPVIVAFKLSHRHRDKELGLRPLYRSISKHDQEGIVSPYLKIVLAVFQNGIQGFLVDLMVSSGPLWKAVEFMIYRQLQR